jgi:DNA-directed RNA polymerase II subunit RPB1
MVMVVVKVVTMAGAVIRNKSYRPKRLCDCFDLSVTRILNYWDWIQSTPGRNGCQVLPIPPLHVRPSVMAGGTSSEDDLTHQIVNCIKSNLTLLNAVSNGEPNVVLQQFELSLQHNVAAFMDNEIRGLPQVTQRSGRPLKTIAQRLKSKEGRIRGNLMGKRVDFSARTVITADPNLAVSQVGVPRSVAMNLTVPTRVTAHNLHEMTRRVQNGPTLHPGAKHIIRSDGTRIDLRYVKNKSELNLAAGWIVERHLQDGDVVLFNRQPSLHKMSIMGHKAKVLDWSTFRLNLSCTAPYNADFDGEYVLLIYCFMDPFRSSSHQKHPSLFYLARLSHTAVK